MSAAVVLQHGPVTPPGLLGDWLEARGIEHRVVRTYLGEGPGELDGSEPLLASLGSPLSPLDAEEPAVIAGREHLRAALAADVPVLGLCYGGQMLAAVLGGEVEPAPEPELGWHRVEPTDPDVPAGPWLQWHFQRFATPPGAELLATSPVGDQAFRHGRSLGTQFHPESTPEIVKGWARKDAERLRSIGVPDGEALVDAGLEHAPAAAEAAFALFDSFLARTRS